VAHTSISTDFASRLLNRQVLCFEALEPPGLAGKVRQLECRHRDAGLLPTARGEFRRLAGGQAGALASLVVGFQFGHRGRELRIAERCLDALVPHQLRELHIRLRGLPIRPGGRMFAERLGQGGGHFLQRAFAGIAFRRQVRESARQHYLVSPAGSSRI
jgi:hypothetical protein